MKYIKKNQIIRTIEKEPFTNAELIWLKSVINKAKCIDINNCGTCQDFGCTACAGMAENDFCSKYRRKQWNLSENT